ncbi:MAG: hypothetical protein US31_C0010G0017 [Berkelbacteria bacterium GW2011_GWA1_36_9]|uniref:Uncharacterized protein n=1 Tax=Berkelbacteria bacterium GW2011_GWA1_36_9 TaxID=1618331 RepID=A0A0G0FGE2_9BACT|nr:MAG: hypothetical protein US31_C0010G0017 [Berkelbacteria bacterium GW2011_GWA1_36_9]
MNEIGTHQYSPETDEDETTERERVSQLESKVEGLTRAVAMLLDERKFLQDRGILNKDPEGKDNTY